jgi:NADH-quinone oxidoreductase subunit B
MGLSSDSTRPDTTSATPATAPPESVFTTNLNKMVRWARSGSLWPLPFGTACCAIEFMSVVSSHYDLARFGAEVVRFSPRQSDMMIVAGTVVDKQAPILKLIYEQMSSPKWVISMGVCASSGGFYRAYHVMQGIDEIIPVDVFVPGCPPTPEGLIYAILKLQEKIERGDPSHYQIVAEREAAEARERRLVGA